MTRSYVYSLMIELKRSVALPCFTVLCLFLCEGDQKRHQRYDHETITRNDCLVYTTLSYYYDTSQHTAPSHHIVDITKNLNNFRKTT
jgi:hypothetical protein